MPLPPPSLSPGNTNDRRSVDVIWLAPFLGFEYLYLHQVDVNQQGFIETFSKHVLPQLR